VFVNSAWRIAFALPSSLRMARPVALICRSSCELTVNDVIVPLAVAGSCLSWLAWPALVAWASGVGVGIGVACVSV